MLLQAILAELRDLVAKLPTLTATQRKRFDGYLAIAKSVIADSANPSHILSVSSTLIRQLHPFKVKVVRDDSLSFSCSVPCLAGCHTESCLEAAATPGSGSPVHVSLCTLASHMSDVTLTLLAAAAASDRAIAAGCSVEFCLGFSL